jgi:AraC family transcriptional regulator, positive regulator of tynA and feaB
VARVLDSAAIAARDRVEALNAAFTNSEVPQSVTYATTGPVRHRMELFDLGPGTHLLRNVGTGLHIIRGPGHVRRGAPEQVAMFMQTRGRGLLDANGAHSISDPGQLCLLDTTRPYAYRQLGDNDHKVLLIDPSQLTLPPKLIRSAAPSLRASPLYKLVQAHFASLCQDSADLPPAAMAMVGRATAELVRALITTATDDIRQAEALQATELLRITMYIDAHLHDRRLNADQSPPRTTSRPASCTTCGTGPAAAPLSRNGSFSDAWNAPATSSPTSTPSWPPSPPSRTAAASPT